MKDDITGVILAGGLGTRLHPLTLTLPKPMLPIADRPLLEYIIEWLRDNGIKRIVICISYLGNIIEDYFKDGEDYGVSILYASTKRPLGTAGQLKSAEPILSNSKRFVCIYGDSLYNFNIKDMIDKHLYKQAFVTVALMPYRIRFDYGSIEVDDNHNVIRWEEKPEITKFINIGCYVMENSFLKLIPANSVVAMNSVFMDAIKQGKRICAYIVSEDTFKDIGNKRSYLKVYREYLRKLRGI